MLLTEVIQITCKACGTDKMATVPETRDSVINQLKAALEHERTLRIAAESTFDELSRDLEELKADFKRYCESAGLTCRET